MFKSCMIVYMTSWKKSITLMIQISWLALVRILFCMQTIAHREVSIFLVILFFLILTTILDLNNFCVSVCTGFLCCLLRITTLFCLESACMQYCMYDNNPYFCYWWRAGCMLYVASTSSSWLTVSLFSMGIELLQITIFDCSLFPSPFQFTWGIHVYPYPLVWQLNILPSM